MSKEECLTADWQQVGFSDGYSGHAQTRLDQHRKACAKADIPVGFEAYQAGWKRGIAEYCSFSRGQIEGIRGRRYSGACPAHLESEFLSGYQPARAVYPKIIS